MEYSLSNNDILNYLDNKCNFHTYKELKNFNNIDELLGKYNKCVLLYLTKENYGHYTALYKVGNTIYFFDPYGYMIDDELKFVPKHLKKELNSDYRYLTELLYNSGYDVEYNEYQLQKKKIGINTCGRWVILRLIYPKISINDFYKLFNEVKDKIDLDKLITLLIS